MKGLALIPKLMTKLSAIPGLGFLQDFVVEAHAIKSRAVDRYEDLGGYVKTGKDVYRDASGAVRGGGRSKNEPSDPRASDYDDGPRAPAADADRYDETYYEDDYGKR